MPASGDPQTSGREPVALRRACCRLTVWAMRLVWMCVLLMFVGWALGGTWWVCDLVNHFWPLGAVLLTASALCLGLCRRWWEVGIAAVALAVNLAAIVPYYIPATVPPGMPLRVVVSNLYSGNPTPAAAIRFLESTDADVLVLLEVDADCAERLAPLRLRYPHGRVLPQDGNFGIALLSRRPLRDVEQINFGQSGVPTLTAVLAEQGVQIVATHPPPPVNSRLAARRDAQLADLAAFCGDSPRPVIVVGDLNATPWSAAFRDLVRRGRLRDSSLGHGLQPTWPTLGPLSLLPIDHVLLSPSLGVSQRTVGPRNGSDHRPVIVDVVLPTAKPE
jgi:endonuclease/exonuclease/phosphatase (EEP) superfamily protein YafD